MKKYILSFFCLLSFGTLWAQNAVLDSLQKAREDSMKEARIKASLQYPIIHAGEWSGVIPIENVDEKPDPKINYRLLFELVYNNKDSMAKEINAGLTEVCRILNLHVASGIPLVNIQPVLVVHGAGLFSLYNNTSYQKKYKVDNPNRVILEELNQKFKMPVIACGQAMRYFEVKREEMVPGIKVAVTAQTVLSGYEIKGYKLYVIKDLN